MKKAEVKIQFVTPCIMGGADRQSAEFRAASVRGALRWWMRALGYGCEQVNALFGVAAGDKGIRSNVVVRDTTVAMPPTAVQGAQQLTGSNRTDYFLWPLMKNTRGVILANATVSFSVHLRSGSSPEVERALKAFLLLGSLGMRSRRCYGSIWPTEVLLDGVKWPIPRTSADFKCAIRELQLPKDLISTFVVTQPNEGLRGRRYKYPDYKGALRECREFLADYRRGKYDKDTDRNPSSYGEDDHDAPWHNYQYKYVHRAALGLPLVQNYHSSGAKVTSTIDGYSRLASPLHFKVIRLDGGFVPLAIFFNKMFPPEGVMVHLRGGEVSQRPLSLDLVEAMREDQQLLSIEKLP